MSYTTKRKLEAHDAAGYETAMEDFSTYDDGYGNRVAHGDLTMQRMVEAGVRDAQMFDPEMEGDVTPTAYDTEPRMSVAEAERHPNRLGAGAAKRRHLAHGHQKVEAVMHEYKRGTLHSGSGEIVKDRDQAVAIAMSEAGLSRNR